MGQTNYLKMLWATLYIVFACISCWATAESLNLTWPSIPLFICYGIAIGFYLVASVGATMVVNSFDRNKFFQNRGLMLAGGVVILLFFWIITSLPTNTHTFLFRNKIANVITEEQKTTNGYLMQIVTGQAIDNRIINDTTELANKVRLECTALETEIMNELNPGDGPKSNEIKKSIANLLGIQKIQTLSGADNSVKGREILARTYRQIIFSHLANKQRSIEHLYRSKSKLREKYSNEAKTTIKNIDTWVSAWNKGKADANDPKDIKADFNDQRLMKGYSLIKNCKEFVEFNDSNQEQRYTAKNLESNISHIISVYDLWYEFIFGTYKGSLFMVFCILISLLVDVAAFVFFYLVQK